ncbi:MAG: hypothetical protein COA58_13280 [Bacteroidetes bacterium]|nr:MAG: hypothetical protein COA58_13280 [Bacteroidota bacterium]
MKKILLILILFACTPLSYGQNGTTCTGINQWVNGDLESTNISCYTFHHNWSFRNNVTTKFQNCPTGNLVEIDSDADANPAGNYVYCDPRGPGTIPNGDSVQVSQTIVVKPNTNYNFTAMFATTTKTGSPQPVIYLAINGQALGNTANLGTVACPGGGIYNPNWTTVTRIWNSGQNTSISAEIWVKDAIIDGNDFAIDNISFTGLIEVDAGMDDTLCDEDVQVLGGTPTAKYGATCNNYSFLWTPSLGLSSTTSSNPVLDVSALTPGLHTYTVQVTDDNGQTCSDDVSIFVQECCKLDIEVTISGCDSFKFEEVIGSGTNKECSYWTLDGNKWNYTGGFVQLPPGEHIICNHMLAYSISNGSLEPCCLSPCVTVSVPELLPPLYIELSYCDMFDGVDFNPLLYGLCADYILSGPIANLPYDSRIYGPKTHRLIEGQYVLECYDQNGCLKQINYINVNKIERQIDSCFDTLVVCLNIIDPYSILPDPTECPSCAMMAQLPENLFAPIDTLGDNSYRKTFTDSVNCKICIFTYLLIDSVCNFTPQFQITYNSSNLFNYDFSLLQPLTNLCGPSTYEVKDNLGNVIATLTGNNVNYTFPLAGDYEICISVSVCVCNTQCTKTRCIPITVYSTPPFFIIHEEKENSNSSKDAYDVFKGDLNLTLVPNPTSAIFKIQMRDRSLTIYDKVNIMDVSGKLIRTFKEVESFKEYDLSEFKKGVYVINVELEGQFQSLKLILK